MFNRCINHLQRVAARQRRSSRYRLILVAMRASAWCSTWWAPREVLAWLRICAQELQTCLMVLLWRDRSKPAALLDRHGSAFFAPVLEWPPSSMAAAPDGFAQKVMARVRALPAPMHAPILAPMPPTELGRSAFSRARSPHPVPILLTSLGIALLLLVGGALAAVFSPGLAVLLLALLVNLLLTMLDVVHVAAEVFNAATANAWTSVPLLVCLLGTVLLVWSLLLRLIETPVVEA